MPVDDLLCSKYRWLRSAGHEAGSQRVCWRRTALALAARPSHGTASKRSSRSRPNAAGSIALVGFD
jgi:hypothetical protein